MEMPTDCLDLENDVATGLLELEQSMEKVIGNKPHTQVQNLAEAVTCARLDLELLLNPSIKLKPIEVLDIIRSYRKYYDVAYQILNSYANRPKDQEQ